MQLSYDINQTTGSARQNRLDSFAFLCVHTTIPVSFFMNGHTSSHQTKLFCPPPCVFFLWPTFQPNDFVCSLFVHYYSFKRHNLLLLSPLLFPFLHLSFGFRLIYTNSTVFSNSNRSHPLVWWARDIVIFVSSCQNVCMYISCLFYFLVT